MAPSSRSTGKRLPISCQACRTRKIRCSRDGRPCQTCVRRGLGAEDCIYLGQPRFSSESTLTADATVHNELLARIRNLEDLLHQRVGSQPGDSHSPLPSPTLTGSFSEPDSAIGLGSVDYTRKSLLSGAGKLQTFASGYVRYLPLAPQWNSANTTSSPGDTLPDINSEVPDDDDDLCIPLAGNRASKEELLAILPPRRYCDALKDVYFRVFSSLFHVLHDLTFEAEYQRFCHDPNSVTTAWISLLFAILSIAVTTLHDDDPLLSDLGREKTVSRNVKVLSSRYRSAALRCLAADGIVARHSINSLQSLILILYARFHHGLPIWTLLGFTHHVATSMGCHVDPERFALGSIEREERRRAWAGLTMLFDHQNVPFGSLNPGFASLDVKLPLDVNDVDLLTSGVSEPALIPTQMTYLLLQYRLHNICSMICDTLFSFPSRYSIPQLEAEILTVHEMCEKRYQLDPGLEPLPAHHLANLNILYSYIHQLFLLLLRPTLCRYLQGDITTETCAARAKCVASAKTSLAIHQTLYESPQFAAYKWYNSGLGSFHAFHAAVILCVMLMYPENQYEANDIKNLLWNSLDVFASLSNRSNFCSKAVPVLRRIIGAACSESHHRQQRQQQQQQPLLTPPLNMDGGILTPTTPPVSYVQSPVECISEALLGQLHPQNWISPSSIPWDGWDCLVLLLSPASAPFVS
ncbi:Zn(II)2Cys6 transcription factor [Aspergillus lucknowensis]|uniref:Zn(2)-C6 fungal-type domain-containing protein n=1 Tax=Aspergillus lucknowensis TaxID=176173 RepID=A0ABR4M6R0_9EURO